MDPTPQLPFLELPLLPMKLALGLMDFMELFELSLLSRRTRHQVKVARIRRYSYALTHEKRDDIKIAILKDRDVVNPQLVFVIRSAVSRCPRFLNLHGFALGVEVTSYENRTLHCYAKDTDNAAFAVLDYCSSLFPADASFININPRGVLYVEKSMAHQVFARCNLLQISGPFDPKTRFIKTIIRAIPSAKQLFVETLSAGLDEMLSYEQVRIKGAAWVSLYDILNMHCKVAWFHQSSLDCYELNVFLHKWLNKEVNPLLRSLMVMKNDRINVEDLIKDLPTLEFDETRRPVFYHVKDACKTLLIRCRPHPEDVLLYSSIEFEKMFSIFYCKRVFDIVRSDGVMATIGVTDCHVYFLVWS